MAETTTNPTVTAPGANDTSSFFGFLGSMAQQIIPTLATAAATAKASAAQTAALQAQYNLNHGINPATGANDAVAAQNAANRTFLDRFLPPSMLYTTDPVTKLQTVGPGYYIALGSVVLVLLIVLRRLMR